MSEAHSPAPFRIVETEHVYLIVDAMGDSIGALARRTGDHPPEEQLANARLFARAPQLLIAAANLLRHRPPSRSASESASAADWASLAMAVDAARTDQGPWQV